MNEILYYLNDQTDMTAIKKVRDMCKKVCESKEDREIWVAFYYLICHKLNQNTSNWAVDFFDSVKELNITFNGNEPYDIWPLVESLGWEINDIPVNPDKVESLPYLSGLLLPDRRIKPSTEFKRFLD